MPSSSPALVARLLAQPSPAHRQPRQPTHLDVLVLGLHAPDVLLDAQQEAVPGGQEGLGDAAGLICTQWVCGVWCVVRGLAQGQLYE